jgi:hypothetical protein
LSYDRWDKRFVEKYPRRNNGVVLQEKPMTNGVLGYDSTRTVPRMRTAAWIMLLVTAILHGMFFLWLGLRIIAMIRIFWTISLYRWSIYYAAEMLVLLGLVTIYLCLMPAVRGGSRPGVTVALVTAVLNLALLSLSMTLGIISILHLPGGVPFPRWFIISLVPIFSLWLSTAILAVLLLKTRRELTSLPV